MRAPHTAPKRVPRSERRQVKMMESQSAASPIDEYIRGFPPETQKALREVRSAIRAAAPQATETISYAIPAFDLEGRHLLFFAGYAKHVGVYPITDGVAEAFKEELGPYRSGRATLRFTLDRPIPADLIRRIVEVRVKEERERLMAA